MSEYQYYEFRAIDRPLSADDREHLRSISSRAEISATSMVNTYEYGDFKGDPLKLMRRCFDLHVYYANWGTRTLMVRVDAEAMDVTAARKYRGEACQLHPGDEQVIVELGVSPDDGYDENFNAYEYEEGEWAERLEPIRELLQAGDVRPLYLGWLAGVQWMEESKAAEPPLPPGLKELPKPLEALVEYLGIDQDVLSEAARLSPELSEQQCNRPAGADYARWIAALPAQEKDALLLHVVQGDAADVAASLQRRYRREHVDHTGLNPIDTGRTISELLKAASTSGEERKRREAEARRLAQQKKDREKAARRRECLQELATRYDAAWQQMEAEIAAGATRYAEATKLLVDLRDAAPLAKPPIAFAPRMQELLLRHGKRTALIKRLRAVLLV
jgi:hypothetical protein